MTTCTRCGVEGVTYGHWGLCANDYAKHQAHQAALREEKQRNRELLAARIVHPSGKGPRYRAKDLWIQKRDPETGRDTA